MADQVRDTAEANRGYVASLAGVVGGTGPGGMITAQDILGGHLRAGPTFLTGEESPTRSAARTSAGFGAITINIAQAPNQDPQALVHALVPVLRAELARGTV
jgi:hypothetical protein